MVWLSLKLEVLFCLHCLWSENVLSVYVAAG